MAVLAVIALIVVSKTAVVVPQQSAFVRERLGRFAGVMNAGFHILIPFIDVIRYRHTLKETAWDIPAQVCITRDNVQVGVDGILYMKVLNPERASYGIADYVFAISQLAQTTLRSEIGKIDLDKTFEERMNINMQVVTELDKASESWGVKVLRYEIKNITPPQDVLAAMEKQMRAEREKRAVILSSEGAARRGHQQRRRRKAAGDQGVGSPPAAADQRGRRPGRRDPRGRNRHRAGIRQVADAIEQPGGLEATQLRVAEQYVTQFGELAQKSNTIILPANVADVASMVSMAMRVYQDARKVDPDSPKAPSRAQNTQLEWTGAVSRSLRSSSCWRYVSRVVVGPPQSGQPNEAAPRTHRSGHGAGQRTGHRDRVSWRQPHGGSWPARRAGVPGRHPADVPCRGLPRGRRRERRVPGRHDRRRRCDAWSNFSGRTYVSWSWRSVATTRCAV